MTPEFIYYLHRCGVKHLVMMSAANNNRGCGWRHVRRVPFVILCVASAVRRVLHGWQTFGHALIHRACGGEGALVRTAVAAEFLYQRELNDTENRPGAERKLQYHRRPVGGSDMCRWKPAV